MGASGGSDGKLKPMGHTKTEGRSPRHFQIDASGRFLLAANTDSGTVAVFKVLRALLGHSSPPSR